MIEKENYQSNNEDIDLKPIINFIMRNKIFLIIFIIFGGSLGYLNFLRTPKVWQGDFQIVVANNSNSREIPESFGFARGILSNNINQEIKTQIIILKSPSVLLDTFNFVKKSNNEPQLRFDSWKKRLIVNQEDNSSVLNIKYSDTNKEIILPVLQNISVLYQEYTNKKRLKSIDLKIKYFEDEINKLTNLTYASIIKSQKFSEKYDVSLSETFKDNNEYRTIQEVKSSEAKIKINEIDQKLNKINKISNLEDLNQYAKIYNLAEGVNTQLAAVDNQLMQYRNFYKENDILIKSLKEQKRQLINRLKEEIIKSLEIQKETQQIILKSNKRDSDIIFNYKKLLFESLKYSETLDNLEKELLLLNFEKSRDSEPWDLITKPTLLPNYLYPSKLKNILSYSFTLLVIGMLIKLVSESREKLVSRNEQIENILGINKFIEIKESGSSYIEDKINLMINSILETNSEKFVVNYFEEENQTINKINDILKNQKNKYLFSNKISDIAKYKLLIPIITLDKLSKKSLLEFKKMIKTLNANILYVIIISNSK